MDLTKWKLDRKAKKEARRDPYDKEELRLLTRMAGLQPGSDEYKEAQAELANVNKMRGDSRESKRKVAKADRGGIIIKVLGLVGGGVGLAAVIKAEKDGLTFTGEKRTVMDSICRAIGGCFHR